MNPLGFFAKQLDTDKKASSLCFNLTRVGAILEAGKQTVGVCDEQKLFTYYPMGTTYIHGITVKVENLSKIIRFEISSQRLCNRIRESG